MHLFTYNKTYQFGRLDSKIQGRKVDIEEWQQWGDIDVGLALVGYWGLTRMPCQTKGGSILCGWKWKRRKGKLAQIVRKCNK